jgi:hypothetical protein
MFRADLPDRQILAHFFHALGADAFDGAEIVHT